MSKKLAALAMISLFSGCAGVDHVGPEMLMPPLAQQAISQAVANQMKDPASSQFRNWHAFQSDKGFLICGEVNAKNSFGGYTGFSHFVGHASSAGKLLTPVAIVPMSASGPDPLIDGVWRKYYPGCYG